jgi:peptidoglycan hydrolase CwlO-like protein
MDEWRITEVEEALRTLDRYSGHRESKEYREAVEVVTLNAKAYADVVDEAWGRSLELESELDDAQMEVEDLKAQITEVDELEERIKEKDARIEELEGMIAERDKEVMA